MTVLSSPVLALIEPRAHADFPYGGTPYNSPNFYPYGPRMNNLEFIIEGTSAAETNDFQQGNLDVTDFSLSSVGAQSTCSQSSPSCTPAQSLYDVYGIVFNHASTFWGISFGNGNSQAGIELRLGIAHLINKQNFVSANVGVTAANWVDCFASPAQKMDCSGPANGNIAAWNTCSWDPLTITNCGSAYHLASSAENVDGTAPIGSADFCAAETHFLNAFQDANIQGVKDSGTNCVLTGTKNLGTINFWVFPQDNALANLENDLAGDIGNLMGDNPSPVKECNANFDDWSGLLNDDLQGKDGVPLNYPTIEGIVYDNCGVPKADNWNILAGGWSLDPVIDQYYWYFNSGSTSTPNSCLNPFSYCRADYDHWSNMAEFNMTYYDPTYHNDAKTSASTAQFILGSTVAAIPIYSHFASFEYTKGWQGIINEAGTGPANSWTGLNAWRPDPSLKGTIRWGLGSTTSTLNPFRSRTQEEQYVLSQIYDSMLVPAPLGERTNGPSMIYEMVSSMSTSYSSSEVSCVPNNGCVTGTTTQTWKLRPDFNWDDVQGHPVTADDVAYTIIAYRDAPSFAYGWEVSRVSSVTALNSATVQVKLQLQSSMYGYYLGSIPIIPKWIWSSPCPQGNYAACVNGSFDPTWTPGDMIGSGPWRCDDLFNVNGGWGGGPCFQNAGGTLGTGALGPGSSILLHRNERYSRCCSNLQGTWLQRFSWADKFDDGVVGISDLSDCALHNKKYDPYWAHPLYGNASQVGLGDIGVIALYNGMGPVTPYALSNTPGLGSPIDPFKIDFTGTNVGQGDIIEYYLGLTYDSTGGTLALATLQTNGDGYFYTHMGVNIYSHGTTNLVTGFTGSLNPNFPGRVIFFFPGLQEADYDLQIVYQSTTLTTFFTIEAR